MKKTCENCKFFKPVTDHRLFDGACHNMRATLGAVIQTSRGSVCNYHEPVTEAAHDPGQPPRQPAEAEKRLVPVHVMGRTRSPSNLPNNSCTGWAPHEPDEATLPLPSTDREPPDYGYCLCGRHRDDQCDYCVSLSSPQRGEAEQ